jgi:sugar phosphate isomerase/epimerase
MEISRRQFMRSSAMGALGVTVASPLMGKEKEAHKIPIGFQLYTVRAEFSRDVPGTLKKLAQIGYQGVEFWDYAGTKEVYRNYDAAALRKILDENGLKCCGMHLQLKALGKESMAQTIEANRILGSQYLNVAGAKEKMSSEQGINELADLLNERSKECKPHDMVVGYHAHPFDFEKFNGRLGWQVLFGKLSPEVNMQMDCGNTLSGKADPIALLKEFPGRTRTIHLKEKEEKTFDSPFYKEVFRLCENECGTKWYIVEMGGLLGNGFDVPREALEKLHAVGK